MRLTHAFGPQVAPQCVAVIRAFQSPRPKIPSGNLSDLALARPTRYILGNSNSISALPGWISELNATNLQMASSSSAVQGIAPGAGPSNPTTIPLTSSTTPAQPAPSLFDPTHIPSLLPRIEHLATLLLTASRDPHSLNEPLTPEQREAVRQAHEERARIAREADKAARAAKGPNVALGANTDGDDEDSYSFFVGSRDNGSGNNDSKNATGPSDTATSTSMNEALLGRPTALREEIVREAQALKDAFASARRAVDALNGGDMDIREQTRLIEVLSEYGKHQNQVRNALLTGSEALLQSDRHPQPPS
ncbi:hypothetical protein A4X06_0g2343 [Tilletia controversa]|uniref:Mediator of RNA polymerase II transcription subunit 4 n=2 Tax=Tilletia TaxID=13289 RepID=A0A8X7MVZ1_9BASI|nr:hypothetical protein CF336_g1878 [Tilletia laevis]KAE8203089.1 hypothetical protein CF328_g1838 [Tilletia controversa]KAE8252225.1 hypothetical protein A4X06_0g2343 [Tilletia controversa]KAE8263832.1 hypothetical protein A4X03_0g1396 [Tilletia caries]